MNDCWEWRSECIDKPIDNKYGFLYMIHIYDPDKGYMWYLGKKSFFHQKKTKISKKRRKEEKTRKRVEILQKDSEWLNYWSSSKEVQDYIAENGTNNVRREIIMLCDTKIDLTYYECFYLMKKRAIFDKSCLNGNILGKFYRNKVKDYE